MISNESSINKHHEISKYSLSNRNFEKSKISYSHSRSDFFAKNKYFTHRKKENKKEIRRKTVINRKPKKKQNKLYEIFEEEKGENSYNIENDYIRKQKTSLKDLNKIVFNRFINKYSNHYTETKLISSDWGIMKPNIYSYYQICNLLDNKKCKIKVYYDEFKYYTDYKENLVDYLNIKESYNILKFIITFLKGNNIYNMNFFLAEKYLYKTNNFKEFIKIILQKLSKNLENNNSILLKVIEEIKILNKESIKNESNHNDISMEIINYIQQNKIFEYDNIDDLSSKLNEYNKFLPLLLKIPLIYFSSIFPNYLCLGYKINLLLKSYIRKRLHEIKLQNSEKESLPQKIEDKLEISDERTKYIRDKLRSYSRLFNDSIIKAKGKSFVNKDNLEEILDDKPIWSFFKKNRKKYEDRRSLYNYEIIDIQNFIGNIKLLKESKRKAIVSFQDKINKEKKGKDALFKKIIDNNNKNKNKNKKYNSSSEIRISRNKNKIAGILKPKQVKIEDKSNKIKNKSIKYILNYNYKKNIKEEKKESKINQTTTKPNNNSLYDKSTTPKIITQYNTKYIYHYPKGVVHSLSDTKNSSSNLIYNESSNFIKGKTTNKFSNFLYNNNSLISTGTTKKNNILQKSSSARIIRRNKFNFKDSKEFLFQSLRNYKKLSINNIPLKNIDIFGLNQSMLDFLASIKNTFNFAHLKSEEIEENEWKKGIFNEQKIKREYDYKKLMQKIKKEIIKEKNRNINRHLFNNKFNMTELTKRNDLYKL